MWDKVNKVQVVHIIAMFVIVTCSVVVVIAAIDGIEKNKEVIRDYFSMGMVGVIGWAFTRSQNRPTKEP